MNENTDEPKSEAAVNLEYKIHIEWAHRQGISAWSRTILGNSIMLSEMGVDVQSLEKLRSLRAE